MLSNSGHLTLSTRNSGYLDGILKRSGQTGMRARVLLHYLPWAGRPDRKIVPRLAEDNLAVRGLYASSRGRRAISSDFQSGPARDKRNLSILDELREVNPEILKTSDTARTNAHQTKTKQALARSRFPSFGKKNAFLRQRC